MLRLEVDLLFGRYHATPWGYAANEGVPEWPPSPWRLARALVSAWYRTPVAARPDQTLCDDVLRQFAGRVEFALPGAVIAHTRHYMPLVALPKKADSSPKVTTSSAVLDPFVQAAQPRLTVLFPDAELDRDQLTALDQLLPQIAYLGRAESQCLITRVDGLETNADLPFWVGELEGDGEPDGEVVSLLCPTVDVSVAMLSQSTAQRREERHDLPAAGEWRPFVLPASALVPTSPPRRQFTPTRAPTVMRFALEGPVLPPIDETFTLAQLFRAASLRRVDDAAVDAVALLRGRDPRTGAVLEGHRHCHYLPTDEDGDGRLDHLTVWCPAGLSPQMRRALDLQRLSSAWRLDEPVHPVLLGVYPDEADDLERCPLTRSSTTWSSETPFIAPRHPRVRAGRLTEAEPEQLFRELARRGLPAPLTMEPLRPTRTAWGAFRSEHRRTGARRAAEPPRSGWTLTFAEPIRGPLVVGRRSHYGLGLFLPQ